MLYYLLFYCISVSLNDAASHFHHCFSHIQSQIVVEVTEEENMSEEALILLKRVRFPECLRWMIMVVVIIP